MHRPCALALLASAACLSAQPPRRAVEFQRDIEPILKSACLPCHTGPKAGGQLRLDSKQLAMRGGISGPVIVPRNSTQSRLLHRVLGQGGEKRMPLAREPLSAAQIAKIRAWIDAGALWPETSTAKGVGPAPEKHWAYTKPEPSPLPAVQKEAWLRNPIDRFVLARLEKEKLAPSPEASREILIRRVSLDLTGLPPTVEDVDGFLNDTSPDAYEKAVDRLLASPHFGERWARPWLDLARYADTNGHEADRRRSIWKFRDWVIHALNQDMPFDRFTIEQIAGDMLSNPTADQLIATGFHRNTMYNEEGGVDKEEAHWENLVDRVNTTASVWLGSTIGCAQCHNHKFDPFTQQEYYQLLAFFNNTDRVVRGSASRFRTEPELELPTAEQATQKKKLEAEIEAIQKDLRTTTPELAQAQGEWEQAIREAAQHWTLLDPVRLDSSAGAALEKQEGSSILVTGPNPSNNTYTIEAVLPARASALRIEAIPHTSLPRGGPGRDAYGNFFLTQVGADVIGRSGTEQIFFEEAFADDGRIDDRKFKQLWSVDATREETRLPRQLVLFAEAPFGSAGDIIRIRIRQTSEFSGQGVGHFRLSVSNAPNAALIINVPAKSRPLLDIPASSRTAQQARTLAEAYRNVAPFLSPARMRLRAARRELDNLGIVSTLVMGEQPTFERPSAPIRIRGSFLSPGELVYANVPAILPRLPDNALPNRLGLARWLVSKDNPLTARVAMNRIWEQYFGRGIVETSEDFGTQGQPPSHPDLLDWLASEFMSRKWSMKAMHRLIVTSAVYRQSSTATPALLDRDPYNRLFARGPRFRMEAEMIRDVTLAASGLLSRKIGGPSVFPYQPEGIWDLPYNDDSWVESKGEDRYRRGIYTFARRTAPYPSMLTFDAPSREFCTVRRVRTNTPLQALTTLNDPAFFAAAKALATRILTQGGADSRARVEYGFRLSVARKPSAAETDRLLTWLDREQQSFASRPADAAALARERPGAVAIGDAEFAAWTMLSNVLLNLDETLTKE
jgi:hypothetical protein